MAKQVLLVFPSECNEFHLTEELEVNLQWKYGASGEVKIKQASCGELYNWSKIFEAGKDYDILAVCPRLANDLIDPSYADIISSNSKPIIIPVGDDWEEVPLKTH